MKYNTRFKMQDLFMNPRLSNVFPQFERNALTSKGFSKKETYNRIRQYLVGALNGVITGKGEITVKGKHKTVLSRVQRLQPIIERLFGVMPTVTANLRNNTKLYTTFSSINELESVKNFDKKLRVMQTVLDNLTFNPDFQSGNTASKPSAAYLKQQEEWKNKVGYKE